MLIVDMSVNSARIGTLTALRIAGDANDDSLNTYQVRLYEPPPEDLVLARQLAGIDDVRKPNCYWEGEVAHRYGDGAWALVAKALDAAKVASPQPETAGVHNAHND